MAANPTRERRPTSRVAIAVGALVWLVVVLVPIYYFGLMSLRPPGEYLTASPWLPSGITLSNYAYVWNNGFPRYLTNSIVVTGVTSTMTVLFGLFAAYAIVRSNLRIVRISFRLLLFGLAIPLEAAIIPMYMIIVSLGLDNSLLGVVLAGVGAGLPVTVLLLVTFLRAVPAELFDAAAIDGAPELRILFQLVVPLSRPVVVPLVIYNAMLAWDNLLLPLVVLQDDSKATLPLGLFHFQSRYSLNVPAVMAAIVLSVVPLFLLFLVLRRQLVSGLTAGALR